MPHFLLRSGLPAALLCLAASAASSAPLFPTSQALTLAQVAGEGGRRHTLLLSQEQGEVVLAVDLSAALDSYPLDALDLLRQHGFEALLARAAQGKTRPYARQALLPSAYAQRHVAAGTNYAAHAAEAAINEVFLFPKYGEPSAARGEYRLRPGELLDYEVELCLRFDRDIRRPADLEAAHVGAFLCGDLSDRAELLRRIDTRDVASGRGFTDAKSGPGRLPTGPYLVVPRDWRQWLAGVRLRTEVDGQPRQDAVAAAMLKGPQALIEQALAQAESRQWRYQGRPVPLLDGGVLAQGQVLLTGTPEGVIYRTPGLAYRAWKGVLWVLSLGFVRQDLVAYVLQSYIDESLAARRYLQPGQLLRHSAAGLGEIELRIR